MCFSTRRISNIHGKFVQKQIELLYGGKMETIRPTRNSKPKRSNENDKNKTGKNPLELKTVKVPAVFRLHNPEFLEQFRNNCFKVGTFTDNYVSRNIPVQRDILALLFLLWIRLCFFRLNN